METDGLCANQTMRRARYREYQPCPVLRPYVKALFTFAQDLSDDAAPTGVNREIVTAAGQSSWSAMFADAGVSIVFCFGEGYRIDGLWQPRQASAHVIGSMTAFHSSFPGQRLRQVGAYLFPEYASFFLGVPGREIAERVFGLDLLWTEAARIEGELAGCEHDYARIPVLESALIRRLKPHPVAISARVAQLARQHGGQMTVRSMAESTGVSRQFLGRVFVRQLGLSPKLYLRLCRFRKALGSPHSGSGWADTAAAFGYFDQSHMIAEFREFSGMTPEAIARQRPFHPFTNALQQLASTN